MQLGDEDWSKQYDVPDALDWVYKEKIDESGELKYDVLILDRNPSDEEVIILQKHIKAHTLFATKNVKITDNTKYLYDSKAGKLVLDEEISDLIDKGLKNYFSWSFGEKISLEDLSVSRNFNGKVKWHGNCYVNLVGSFGDDYCQAVLWRRNILINKDRPIELWLEYEKDATVDIKLVVRLFSNGSVSDIIDTFEFDENDMEQPIFIENHNKDCIAYFCLMAKGRGEIDIKTLHYRYSRQGHGVFLPGGERAVTSNREEIFFYFEPGDMKPPLNVYFSDYRVQEGFEGYYLMKSLGCPFLLISDMRLEGGCFYKGSEEYEEIIVTGIRKYMRKLKFLSTQVVISGISMGAFGALYYGCDISPHALVLGKPLTSIGNVAMNETLGRVGSFSTALDVLMNTCGDITMESAEKLNDLLWDKFHKSYWRRTKFIVTYMLEDDYDRNAYEQILSNLPTNGVQIYGKGIHGRHNDDKYGIINWFTSQFKEMLRDDFDRGK